MFNSSDALYHLRMSENRLTEKELTDIEIRARDVIAESAPESCPCPTCELARHCVTLVTELRALQSDIASTASVERRTCAAALASKACATFDALDFALQCANVPERILAPECP